MRYAALLCAAVLACAANLGAQTAMQNMPREATSFEAGTAFPAVPAIPAEEAEPAALPALPSFAAANFGPNPFGADPAPAEPPPQGVSGVFPIYEWQVSVGYTFTRFYEVPGSSVNGNGANASVAYWFKDWVAPEGEVDATFGSLSGSTAHFVFGGGGLRVRRAFPGNLEGWAHALAGGCSFTPQTVYGSTGSFAYEVGGGVDILTRRRKIAYRIEGDAIGTFFFNTYQVSPKVSVGVVYNF